MITPYYNRVYDLDYREPVDVYRNVNKKGVVYSIRQGGYVVAHATEITLLNAEFIVKDSGKKRVRKTGVKNVHAWVTGEILKERVPSETSDLRAKVIYNPKKNDTFVLKGDKLIIKSAPLVVLNGEGVFVDNSVGM
jgi:hypothetical protein